jgi:hypothetical protein
MDNNTEDAKSKTSLGGGGREELTVFCFY